MPPLTKRCAVRARRVRRETPRARPLRHLRQASSDCALQLLRASRRKSFLQLDARNRARAPRTGLPRFQTPRRAPASRKNKVEESIRETAGELCARERFAEKRLAR